MFLSVKRFLIAVVLLGACRPAGGNPSSGETVAARPAVKASGDSARTDSLLERADKGRIQGDSTAPVWLVEISDFQCPFCKQWHDEIYPVIVRDYVRPGHVRMAYVNYPLPQHTHAEHAAEAALCAAAQDRFWPMHDVLFNTQPRWSKLTEAAQVVQLFDSLAVASGVNAVDWRGCMRSGIMRRVINADRGRATSSGVRSTPTFFVGDQPIQGLAPLGVFRAAIERARAKSAGTAPR